MNTFTYKDFQKIFPDDDACLEWLRRKAYPNDIYCSYCKQETKHYRIHDRKVYTCDVCSHHYSPTAGTIFEHSSTPLTIWFYVTLSHGTKPKWCFCKRDLATNGRYLQMRLAYVQGSPQDVG